MSAESVFWSRVDRGSECWLWTGAPNGSGYGTFRQEPVHRWAYKEFVGPIPEGFVIDHLCGVRMCVRPTHLEAVTPQVNVQRSDRHPKDGKCQRGHDDWWVAPGDGRRRCRSCTSDRKRGRVVAYEASSVSRAI